MEKRICKIHGRPITPSNVARKNRNRGCSKCDNERNKKNGSRQRHWKRKNYKEAVKRRNRLSGKLRGFELFNHSIGYQLISPKGAIII